MPGDLSRAPRKINDRCVTGDGDGDGDGDAPPVT
jgi:hypothetical protein